MQSFRDMAEGFREYMTGQPVVLLIAVIVLALAVLGWLTINTLIQERRLSSAKVPGLFRDLCRAHDLTPRERRILKRIVRYYQLEDPAMLFVRQSLFESAPGVSQAEADELRRRLYGS